MPDIPKTNDLIIAGAGAAGLNLLHHLLESRKEFESILLIDQELTPARDRTWCFWEQDEPWMGHLAHSWSVLQARSFGQIYEERLHEHRYYCISGEAFTGHMLEEARKSESVRMLRAEILGFDFDESHQYGIVHTSKGAFRAPWVFQSIETPGELKEAKVDNDLLQHFTGWEIQVDKAVFDPEKVIWMDFDVEQLNGLTFVYLLPFSPGHALVEHTIFSQHTLDSTAYESAIVDYLRDRYGLNPGEYQITRTERGAIPMNDRAAPGHLNPGTCNIGTVGGLTKPSTGYTFMRIDQHSKMIRSALENGLAPPSWPGSSYRFRVYDMMLLYLLAREPGEARQVFHRLFDRNRMESILTFLDEKSRFSEEIAIFSKMPYLPFFRSMAKMSHRILTGA